MKISHTMFTLAVVFGLALISSAWSTADANPGPPSKKSTSQTSSKNSSRKLKPPTRSVGALKASYNGRYDAPNRTIDAQRARRSRDAPQCQQ